MGARSSRPPSIVALKAVIARVLMILLPQSAGTTRQEPTPMADFKV